VNNGASPPGSGVGPAKRGKLERKEVKNCFFHLISCTFLSPDLHRGKLQKSTKRSMHFKRIAKIEFRSVKIN
jgi:hypothetical protein